jgi:hypothetical protein
MLVVTLIGFVMSLVVYRERLKGRAAYHRARMSENRTRGPAALSLAPGTLVVKDPEAGTTTSYQMTPRAQWHARMESEYLGSADRIGLLIAAVPIMAVVLAVITSLRRRNGHESAGR